MIWRSLRAKLAATFSIVALALIALAGLAVFELRALEHRLAIEHTTTTLFDLTREMRNRENRLFLFRKTIEFQELQEAVDATEQFMNDELRWPPELASATEIAALRSGLSEYRGRLKDYWRQGRAQRAPADQAEDEIRRLRRNLVGQAEALAKAAQRSVQSGLARHRTNLAIGIGGLVLLMIAVAHFLTRRIVRPLKSIENQMEHVADGRIARVEFSWQDRELVSLATAFNHVMTELEFRQARAVQAEKLAALGTMLSGVAHELNNPLSNISTTIQIVSEEAEHLSIAESRRLFERIDQQTERARNIVRTLLEYARADREQVQSIAAEEIVLGAIESINQGRGEPRRIMVDCPADITLFAHRERLRRALINLIDNAIGATNDEDPIVILVRSCHCGDGSAGVEFVVQDCGVGLSTPQLARIFDPFYTTKPAGQGTGLGLFITHEIVKQHGGTIDVVSIPGSGTSVVVRIPAHRKAES